MTSPPSPHLFLNPMTDSIPLSQASALPDDLQQLKALLAKTYCEAQQVKLATNEYKKRRADQYHEL